MKRLSMILALLVMFSTTSWAQESAEDRLNEVVDQQAQAKKLKIINQAWNAYKLKDYESAFGLWLPLAENGNPSAQVYLGLMYSQGHSVLQDISEAAKWYDRASNQDYTPAKWRLAMLYYHGSGLTQNYKKAADLYFSAAKQGDVYSQKTLGVMYSKGFGVPKDNVFAYTWFRIAEYNGFKLAQTYQSKISKKMTPEETAIAEAMAKECIQSNYTKCGWLISPADEIIKDNS